MPDGLYERDIVVWVDQQAALLRRLAAGERVNAAVDWENLIDEVETVARNEIRACASLLGQAILHVLKLHAEPDSLAANLWRSEVVGFLADARRAYTPSMRHRIDLNDIYRDARRRIDALLGWGVPGPAACPFAWEDLIAAEPDVGGLVATLAAHGDEGGDRA